MPADQRPRTAARRAAEARRVALAQAAATRRRRSVAGGLAAAAAVVIALVVVIVVQDGRTSIPDRSAVPGNTVADGAAVRVGDAGAPVVVEVYEDYLCPVCRAFEEQNAATLAELVDSGAAAVEYHPVAILDRASTDRYSTRALNAAAVVADAAGPEAFVDFSGLLFAAQPEEGGPGLSDDRLVALAEQAGATGTRVADGIRDLAYEDWTRRVTDEASKAGLQGTPTIRVDGEELPLREATPEGIAAAVSAAAQG